MSFLSPRSPVAAGRLFAAFMLCCALLPAQTWAFCGFFAGKADASLFNEASQVVLARDGQRTVISMLNDYKGPLNEFALVVPTPSVVRQGDVKIAERATFDRLDAFTSPRLAEYHDRDPCQVNFSFDWITVPPPPPAPRPAAAAPPSLGRNALGVKVETAFTLEEYDIVTLSATQSKGLEVWLRQNGYRIPRGAAAALKPYVNQGMKFFVAKVNLKEQAKTGYTYLRPLQFAFESEKFMLPMRLGMLNAPPDKPQDLIVYVLSRAGRAESSNYRTVKLPANMNLPAFIKPRFKEFYQALFDTHARREDFRVVFTEYFWDMSWCDPCADRPLSGEELRKAGAFWVQGEAQRGRPFFGGAAPAQVTRLHARYTPTSFADDLMLTLTGDRENFQARYVVQNPYGGSMEACNAKVAAMDCEAMCVSRVEQIGKARVASPQILNPRYRDRSEPDLRNECRAACTASKQKGIDAAFNYYTIELPRRIALEKNTLANLTGWTLAEIDRMPGADWVEQYRGAQKLQLVPPTPEPMSLAPAPATFAAGRPTSGR